MKYISLLSLVFLIGVYFLRPTPESSQPETKEKKAKVSTKPSPTEGPKQSSTPRSKYIKPEARTTPAKIKRKTQINNARMALPEKRFIMPQDKENGDLYLTQVFKDQEGNYIGLGDVLITTAGETAIIPLPKLWPEGKVPFVLYLNDEKQKEVFRNAAKTMNDNTNTYWHEVSKLNAQNNFLNQDKSIVKVQTYDSDETICLANVGMQKDYNDIKLHPLCGQKEILHEMMHTLGFFHQQNKIDRDQHIQILWENIEEKYWPNFQAIMVENEKGNIPFYQNSLMMYSSRAFSNNEDYSIVDLEGQPLEPPPTALTRQDVEAINTYYPKEKR